MADDVFPDEGMVEAGLAKLNALGVGAGGAAWVGAFPCDGWAPAVAAVFPALPKKLGIEEDEAG